MNNINFIAIDFETATAKRSSICEAGICVVKGGKVVETKSWLVRPEDNRYSYWNMQVHGIRPQRHSLRTYIFKDMGGNHNVSQGLPSTGSPQCNL